MATIKTVCGWCGKHLDGPRNADQISHGICPDCDRKMRQEIEAHKSRRGAK